MLQGCHLRVVAAEYPPAVTYIEDNCTSNACFQGMFADVWDEMSRDMNFTYLVRRTEDWGSWTNGSWSGMIRMLEQGKVDVAVAGLTITKDRSNVIDFLPSLLEVKEQLFLNTPDDSMYLYAYGNPLAINSWLGVVALVFLVPIILAGILFFNHLVHPEEYELSHCYWYVIETLMSNISMGMPRGNSSRISFVSVLIAGLVIHYYWEAMLISYLVVRKPELPFSTLDELAGQSRYRLLISNGTVHIDRFRHSKDPNHAKIWKNHIEPNLDKLPSYMDMINVLLKNPSLVMYEEAGAKHHPAYHQCQFIDTGKTIYTSQIAWALPKNSTLYPILSRRINRLKETGLIQRFSKRYQPQSQRCSDYNGKPICLKQCITPFLVLVAGILGSLVWFVLEIFIPFEWMNHFLTLGNNKFKDILIKIRQWAISRKKPYKKEKVFVN